MNLTRADCPPDAAFAGNASFDFINTGPGDEFDAFWAADNTTLHHHGLDFDTNGNGLALAVRKAGDAPTLVSHKYLLFGKVSVTAKAARGPRHHAVPQVGLGRRNRLGTRAMLSLAEGRRN